MNTQLECPCQACGQYNHVHAFQCSNCRTIFDGSGGHSVPKSQPASSPALPAKGTPGWLPQRRSDQGGRHPAHTCPIRDIVAALITFNNRARIWAPPSRPWDIEPFTLRPDGSTNEAAGLQLAQELWQDSCPERSLDVVLFGDGEPTAGGGLLGSPVKAALKAAEKLKEQGGRIAAIGFEGPSMDPAHLRLLASSPGLMWMAREGTLESIFREASSSMTESRTQHEPSLLAFVIDSSGSMDEDNKRPELERAVKSCLSYLGQLCGAPR